MALSTTFNRLKREIGIKRCLIIDGNVGDVYLNDKKQIVDLKQYLMDMLKGMEYDDVLYWDRIDGVDGDVSKLTCKIQGVSLKHISFACYKIAGRNIVDDLGMLGIGIFSHRNTALILSVNGRG